MMDIRARYECDYKAKLKKSIAAEAGRRRQQAVAAREIEPERIHDQVF